MITMLGVYFFISLIVAAPFLARYVIVSVRERSLGEAHLMDHFEQKFLQRF